MTHRTERELTAFHEAGHAVLGIEIGNGVQCATIKPDEETGFEGCVQFNDRLDVPEGMLPVADLICSIGGRIAEEIAKGETVSHGFVPDYTFLLDQMELSESGYRAQSGERFLNLMFEALALEADFLLRRYWPCVESIAESLMNFETLGSGQIMEAHQAGLAKVSFDVGATQ